MIPRRRSGDRDPVAPAADTPGAVDHADVPLLDASFLASLERLQVGTRRRLSGALVGEHRSSRRGTSIDFADYREYHPGDDFRGIDYNVLARLDQLLVKLFEAEDEVLVRLLIDTSASMASGGKLVQAARLAAAIGFVSLSRRDPVVLSTFPFDVPRPRYLGRGAVQPLFSALGGLRAGGTTDVVAAAAALLGRPGPPGLTVLVSDLLTAEWEPAISRLPSRRGDLVVVHVLADEDLQPSVDGDIELVDAETGVRVDVSVTADVIDRYRHDVTEWVDRVQQRCHHFGAAYLQVRASESIEPLLLGAWRRSGALR